MRIPMWGVSLLVLGCATFSIEEMPQTSDEHIRANGKCDYVGPYLLVGQNALAEYRCFVPVSCTDWPTMDANVQCPHE